MTIEKYPLGETGNFSPFFLDYIYGKEGLKPYYGLFPDKPNFKKQADLLKFPEANRKVLTAVLKEQYKGIRYSEKVRENIDSLNSANTFTITTGHQLNIFTGPLYFIYKILTAINTAEELNKLHPDKKFVPVYWMASEDHDFAEINHIYFSGRKITWNTEQKGAVGRFDPVSINSLKELLNFPENFIQPFLKNSTLAGATRELVNYLFGEYGLLILDPDNREQKMLLREVILNDVTGRKHFPIVNSTTEELQEKGYHTQVNAREINFFYLDDQLRERIVFEDNQYKVLNSSVSFSENEIRKEIEEHPEKFSPNVILRPLYQQIILPNISYIGGPAEIVYWLQLKGIFELYSIPFPILQPRNFGLIVNKPQIRKLQKTGLSLKDLFQEENKLKLQVLKTLKADSFYLNGEISMVAEAFEGIKERAGKTDKTHSYWQKRNECLISLSTSAKK
jgi:bacillithiol synthase